MSETPPPFDYDYIVIGSGFGGSVSAMRLAEKGYSVAVFEQGKRFGAADFPETNWNLFKFLWWPTLFMRGFMRVTILRHVTILSGAGVGGGSLVYANTQLVPPQEVFTPEAWARPEGTDVYAEMLPFYHEAQRMLGSVKNPLETEADRVLASVSKELGYGEPHATTVGVYFGKAGVTVNDPYFGGEGPERTGCNMCGGCMVGCRHNAKNSLDKNYLYFAEKWGARVYPETTVTRLRALEGEGYEITTEKSFWGGEGQSRVWRARNVVVAAGVLGTMPLLLASKEQGDLPNLSPRLGDFVRTNSEAILNVVSGDKEKDYSKGIAITSGVYPDKDTHVEVVRYPDGSDAMGLMYQLLTRKVPWVPRLLVFLFNVLLHPLRFLRSAMPVGWARRSIILLVMQTLDNYMRVKLKKPWFFGRPSITTELVGAKDVPSYIPIAYDFAEKMAEQVGGFAQSPLNDMVFDIPVTAHIMGGACIGRSPETGVVDAYNRAYGHPGLYVIDGSMLPTNLGVNPSLTITAKAEHAMSAIPRKAKSDADFTLSRPPAAEPRATA
jgi:cholesterol oxidase